MVKSIFHKESELFIVKTPVPVAQSGTKVTSGLGGGSSTQSKGSEPIMVPSIIRSGYVRSVTLYSINQSEPSCMDIFSTMKTPASRS